MFNWKCLLDHKWKLRKPKLSDNFYKLYEEGDWMVSPQYERYCSRCGKEQKLQYYADDMKFDWEDVFPNCHRIRTYKRGWYKGPF